MTLQDEFQNFMYKSFSNVSKESAQWRVMELVWFSSALLTSARVYEGGEDGLRQITEEAYSKCHDEVQRRKKELREVNSELN